MLSIFSCSPIKNRNLHKVYPEEDAQIDRNLERQILEKSFKTELNDSTVIRHIQISEAKNEHNENKNGFHRQHTVFRTLD